MKKKKLDIIYEDKEILVVNKPSGLLCISTLKEKERTLYHEVSDYVKKSNPKAKLFIIGLIINILRYSLFRRPYLLF